MSMDDRRMERSAYELSKILDRDTLGIIIDYAQYSEVEKVWIALHHHKIEGGLIWAIFDIPSQFENYSDDIDYVSIETNGLDRASATRWGKQWQLGDQLMFQIIFGNYDLEHAFHVIDVPTEDLIPSAGLQIVTNNSEADYALDACRAQYLAKMQAAIDKI